MNKMNSKVVRDHMFFVKFLGKLNVYLSMIILTFYLLLRFKIYYRISENERAAKREMSIRLEEKKKTNVENQF